MILKKMFIEFAMQKTSHAIGVDFVCFPKTRTWKIISKLISISWTEQIIPCPEKQVLASDRLCDLEDFKLISRNCVILRLKPFLFQIALSCTPGMIKIPKVISSIPED